MRKASSGMSSASHGNLDMELREKISEAQGSGSGNNAPDKQESDCWSNTQGNQGTDCCDNAPRKTSSKSSKTARGPIPIIQKKVARILCAFLKRKRRSHHRRRGRSPQWPRRQLSRVSKGGDCAGSDSTFWAPAGAAHEKPRLWCRGCAQSLDGRGRARARPHWPMSQTLLATSRCTGSLLATSLQRATGLWRRPRRTRRCLPLL